MKGKLRAALTPPKKTISSIPESCTVPSRPITGLAVGESLPEVLTTSNRFKVGLRWH